MLIADAGSTKIHWVYTSLAEDDKSDKWTSAGINPLMSPQSLLDETSTHLKLLFEKYPIKQIHYYGAGCATQAAADRIRAMLCASFPKADIHIESDILGAARALCGHEPGICSILGTGSATCFYDGKRIIDRVPSMGYILGDEGSGARLGRELINFYFKRALPVEIMHLLEQTYDMSIEAVLDMTYRQPGANRYLASFVPFIKEHIDNPDSGLEVIVENEFDSFVRKNLLQYPQVNFVPLHFTGSISSLFSPLLIKVLDSYGLHPTSIIRHPIIGMIKYHKDEI